MSICGYWNSFQLKRESGEENASFKRTLFIPIVNLSRSLANEKTVNQQKQGEISTIFSALPHFFLLPPIEEKSKQYKYI